MFDRSMIIDLADRLGVIQRIKHKLLNHPDEAADKLVIVLEEISKIWMSIDSELVKFLTLDFEDSYLREDRSVLLTLESGNLSVRINEARGHCHKIENIHQKYLKGWFDRALNSDQSNELNSVFDLLGNMDGYMIRQIEHVVGWLSPKAEEVLDFVDDQKIIEARQMVKSARKEITPFRKDVAKLLSGLTELQAEFVAISGAV